MCVRGLATHVRLTRAGLPSPRRCRVSPHICRRGTSTSPSPTIRTVRAAGNGGWARSRATRVLGARATAIVAAAALLGPGTLTAPVMTGVAAAQAPDEGADEDDADELDEDETQPPPEVEDSEASFPDDYLAPAPAPAPPAAAPAAPAAPTTPAVPPRPRPPRPRLPRPRPRPPPRRSWRPTRPPLRLRSLGRPSRSSTPARRAARSIVPPRPGATAVPRRPSARARRRRPRARRPPSPKPLRDPPPPLRRLGPRPSPPGRRTASWPARPCGRSPPGWRVRAHRPGQWPASAGNCGRSTSAPCARANRI